MTFKCLELFNLNKKQIQITTKMCIVKMCTVYMNQCMIIIIDHAKWQICIIKYNLYIKLRKSESSKSQLSLPVYRFLFVLILLWYAWRPSIELQSINIECQFAQWICNLCLFQDMVNIYCQIISTQGATYWINSYFEIEINKIMLCFLINCAHCFPFAWNNFALGHLCKCIFFPYVCDRSFVQFWLD